MCGIFCRGVSGRKLANRRRIEHRGRFWADWRGSQSTCQGNRLGRIGQIDHGGLSCGLSYTHFVPEERNKLHGGDGSLRNGMRELAERGIDRRAKWVAGGGFPGPAAADRGREFCTRRGEKFMPRDGLHGSPSPVPPPRRTRDPGAPSTQ